MATRRDRMKVLAELHEKHGYVQPSMLVKAAKPKSSRIHDEFEWDDKIAAEAHRLSTARRMIRTTPIRSKSGVEQKFVHVPSVSIEGPTAAASDREGKYKPADVVAGNPDDFAAALRELQSQVDGIETTMRELKRAAKKVPPTPKTELLSQLNDGIHIVKTTLRLMLDAA